MRGGSRAIPIRMETSGGAEAAKIGKNERIVLPQPRFAAPS